MLFTNGFMMLFNIQFDYVEYILILLGCGNSIW